MSLLASVGSNVTPILSSFLLSGVGWNVTVREQDSSSVGVDGCCGSDLGTECLDFMIKFVAGRLTMVLGG